MSNNLIWIYLLILQAFVTSLPLQDRYDLSVIAIDHKPRDPTRETHNYEETQDKANEQVISVRITSSVAVGRGKEKLPFIPNHKYESDPDLHSKVDASTTSTTRIEEINHELSSDLPPNLAGANIEYIKQLNAKKDPKDHIEPVHPFQLMVHGQHPNENAPTQSETTTNIYEYDPDIKDIPTARKVLSVSDANRFHEHKDNRAYQQATINVPFDYYNRNSPMNLTTDPLFESAVEFGHKIDADSKGAVNDTSIHTTDQEKEARDANMFVSSGDNVHPEDSIAESSIKSVEFAKTMATVPPLGGYIHRFTNSPLNQEQSNQRLTTVSFNIVHDNTKSFTNNEPSSSYVTTSQVVPNQQQFYGSPKIYSKPAQIYSEPSKFYSEPAKIYSEPAKIYSEPAKVYSEPAKIYSEPAKYYSEPASLHLNENVRNVPPSWDKQPQHNIGRTTVNTTPLTTFTNAYAASSTQMEHQPEKNYEVDEKISVLTDGKSHGVQESSTEKCKQDNCKVGYVVEGRQFKKYRVEERTSDGFIVGEYGVVRNEDGALRGVRYTADSDASPRLIHDALMKFLQLK